MHFYKGAALKSILTYWAGRYFRSRLEARWAVFFDSLGIAYEYEKEGYDLGSGICYLPDFWLTDLKFWVEIKPGYPSEEEYSKAAKLSASSGIPLYMSIEPIGNVRPWCPPGVNPADWNHGDDPPQHIRFSGEDGESYVESTRSTKGRTGPIRRCGGGRTPISGCRCSRTTSSACA
jgi:hypothetical protein